MRSRKILIALFLPIATLVGCATSYQKEGVFTNGYSDFRKAEDKFVVTFRANEHTPEDKVLKYALARCAEVALAAGFQYFTVLDQTGKGNGLHYPSLRLTIQCYHFEPADRESIDAEELVVLRDS